MFDPYRGEIRRWRACKYIIRNAFTHSHICAEMPPVGPEPENLHPLAHTVTKLTKMVTGARDQFYAHKTKPRPANADPQNRK